MNSRAWRRPLSVLAIAAGAPFCVSSCGVDATTAIETAATALPSSSAVSAHVDSKKCPGGSVAGAAVDYHAKAVGAGTALAAIEPMEASWKGEGIVSHSATRIGPLAGELGGADVTTFAYQSDGVTIATVTAQRDVRGWLVISSNHCAAAG